MRLFNIDSPLMQALGKMADLMWLNVLTLICCIPIITAGASLTAMNYMALKIVRDEECYITKGFFKSFKDNFKQATVIWLILLVVIVVLIGDFYVMSFAEFEFGNIMRVAITLVAVFVVFEALYVFPVLAKFENTIWLTIKNSFLLSIMQFPKTILMIILYLLPVGLLLVAYQVVPLVFLFGLSAPAWASAHLYNKIFKRLEDRILASSGEAEDDNGDEHIFSDALDESLTDSSQSS